MRCRRRAKLALILATAVAVADAAAERQTQPLPIHEVGSFDYFIAPGVGGAPRVGQQFHAAAAEPYDMLIADYYAGHDAVDPASVREFQDSSARGKLAIAYLDASEFMRCCSNIDRADQDRWFDEAGELTAAAPGWFGPRNPKFKNLWAVRAWDPAWLAYLLSEIDKIVALGFDGVFLDVLYSDDAWGPKGFAAGQAGFTDYREGQTKVAKAVWDHVHRDLHLSRFIIIANYSGVADDNAPALTEGLRYADAFMKESEYYGRDDRPAPWTAGRSIESYFAARHARFFAGMAKLHKVVLLQNYDVSFDNEAQFLKQCALYGYLPSNTHFPQNAIHIDALPQCNSQVCAATEEHGRSVTFRHTSVMP